MPPSIGGKERKRIDGTTKILMVYAQAYPHIGCLSTQMELIGRGLRELGNEVDYLSQSSLPRMMQVVLFGGAMTILNTFHEGSGDIYFLYMSRILFTMIMMLKLHFKQYDAINAHHISSGISAYTAGKGRGIPVEPVLP
jgi:hypothetical protein